MSLTKHSQLETANTVDDCPTVRFEWTIENFSALNTRKLYSESFYVGGYKWRVLMFPKGNNVDHLSMYLDVADSATLPHQWSRNARFSLAVIDQIYDEYTVRKDTQHQFNELESDWGFVSFMPLSVLYESAGYLVNDTVVVEADVTVNCSQASKKKTGNAGLKNRKAESQPQSQDSNSRNGLDRSSPPQQALQPTSSSKTPSVNAPQQGSSKATPVSDTSNIPRAGGLASSSRASDNARGSEDAAPPGKVRFLSYWVSSDASLVLERIHNRYKDTLAKFSMTSPLVQTVFLESFASFIESMSTTKIYEVNADALRLAAITIKDFELVGLDLSWLKQRLNKAKMVNEHSESLASYESAIEETRAKLRELEDGLAKAKAEAEVWSGESLGVNDSVLEGLVSLGPVEMEFHLSPP